LSGVIVHIAHEFPKNPFHAVLPNGHRDWQRCEHILTDRIGEGFRRSQTEAQISSVFILIIITRIIALRFFLLLVV
jgi:hypothetical protein